MTAITNKIDTFWCVIIAIFSYVFGEHWLLFAVYLGLNAVDLLTRWYASYINGTENSSKCSKGITKKFFFWIEILLGFSMSVIFIELGTVIGVNLNITKLIGWYVLGSRLLNEYRSILENLCDGGINVPKVLVKGLEIANKGFEAAEEAVGLEEDSDD